MVIMISKLILGSAILSSLALAAPFPAGVKPAWTVTETAYTTLDITTTIYIDDSKTMSGGAFQPTFAPQSISSTSSSAPLDTAPPAPAIAAQSTTMSTSVIPTASPAIFYTPSSSSTSPAVMTPAAIIPTTPSSSTSSTPAAPAAASPSATLAKNGGTGAPTSASDSASCQGESAACQGDITYYGGGLGACGVNVDPSGNGIALPYEFMGTASNSNPYCGKTLTIYNPATGASVQATVMDKCMGCTGRSIDLTETLFGDLTGGDTGLGRVSGVDWWFN
jgi:hypothetical protein